MASAYKRTDSPYIWIRYKDAAGKWQSKNTGYRQDNIGDRKQAKQLVKKKSLEEMGNKTVRVSSHRWEEWVIPWIDERWGNRTNRTPNLYTDYFWRWLKYFRDIEITHPAALRREHVSGYLAVADSMSRNAFAPNAVQLQSFLSRVMTPQPSR
jgi:hypothetical protein